MARFGRRRAYSCTFKKCLSSGRNSNLPRKTSMSLTTGFLSSFSPFSPFFSPFFCFLSGMAKKSAPSSSRPRFLLLVAGFWFGCWEVVVSPVVTAVLFGVVRSLLL